jgi:glucose/arabinose dehydrogenase
MVKVREGSWYGWPEYFNGKPVTSGKFDAPGSDKPTFLWKDHPKLELPFTTIDPHSAINGFAFAPAGFGFAGNAFAAGYGTFTPVTTGPNVELSGFNVMRIDMNTGKVTSFASNKAPGPSYINRMGGFNRPSDVLFAQDGSMFIVDWGGSTVSKKGLEFEPGTGVVWRIYILQGTN